MTFEEKQAKLERVLIAYTNYYDIERENPEGDGEFVATAQFHSLSEKYVLVKKAKLWSMEQHEYVYFMIGEADADTVNTLSKKAIVHFQIGYVMGDIERVPLPIRTNDMNVFSSATTQVEHP